MSLAKWMPTFRNKVLPPSSRVKFFLDRLHLKIVGDSAIHRHFGATHPTRQHPNPGELNPPYKGKNEIKRKHKNYYFRRQFPLFCLIVSKRKKPQHLILSLLIAAPF